MFFGAADACVVDKVSLDLAKEMNPQLGQLTVLARSRRLIESVTATPVAQRPYQTEMIDAILSLHEDVSHRQLLMVVKAERVVRLQSGDLDTVRALWREYCRLPGAVPNRPPVPAVESDPAGRGKDRY